MTTPIPVEAGGVLEFTPECLDHLPMKPVIYLRCPERRHKNMVRTRFIEEGVRHYSSEQWRDCFLEGFKAEYGDQVYDEDEPRIKEFWQAFDQHQGPEDFTPPGSLTVAQYNGLIMDVTTAHRPLREMNAAMDQAEQYMPMVTISLVVQGWKNIDLECVRKAGLISVDTAFDLCDAIDAIERSEYLDQDRALQARNQLWIECSKRLFLSEEQRKNLSSPATSSANPSDLSDGQASIDGQSTMSESST